MMFSIFQKLLKKTNMHPQVLSLNAYLDKNHDLLIIPQAIDKDGIYRDINHPTTLNFPHDFQNVGSVIRSRFHLSRLRYTPDKLSQQVFTVATGIKSYSIFSRDRQLVKVMFDEPNQSYSFELWRREKDGSYIPTDEPSTILTGDVSDFELGQALLKTYLPK